MADQIVAVNMRIKLAPTRRRGAKSMIRLFDILTASDNKLYARQPPVIFLPVFPKDDAELQAAMQIVYDRLTLITQPW